MGALSIVDLSIIVVYLIGMVLFGLYIGRSMHSGKDFFLGGRSLPWWAIGMSLVATDIGATDIIGVGGATYTFGLAVANFEWIGCVPAMIIAAFIFIPFFWRAGVYTIPEFMEKRFNLHVRISLSLCWIIFMACNLGIMLYASAKMGSVLFGWDETFLIFLTALLVGIYTFVGGIKAVVYLDSVQCTIMIGGCLTVLVIGLVDIGGVGVLWDKIHAMAELQQSASAANTVAEKTSIILPVDTTSPFPWTAILFGLGMVLAPAYWIGNQAIVQRSFGAKTEFEAKAAFIWGALLKNLIPVVIAVPGLIALIKFPELADGDKAIPSLIAHMLPIGLKGLFLASFLAALMSSIDSYLNSASAIVTSDIYKRLFNPKADDEYLLKIGRGTTFALTVWAILFALTISRIEGSGIYAIFQTLMAFFQGPSLALIITGILWRRATGKAAFIGFLGGLFTSISLFTLNQEAVYTFLGLQPLFEISEPFLYFSFWSFVVALSLIVVVSYLTAPEPIEKIGHLLYSRKENRS
jgi:SSS family solute:Na+ symporter